MVYKGCQRKMIMLKNPGSEYFEEAYFIVKEKIDRKSHLNENDMISEANRIITENMISSASFKNKKTTEQKRVILKSFLFGVICGIFAAALFFVIGF